MQKAIGPVTGMVVFESLHQDYNPDMRVTLSHLCCFNASRRLTPLLVLLVLLSQDSRTGCLGGMGPRVGFDLILVFGLSVFARPSPGLEHSVDPTTFSSHGLGRKLARS